jgi:hypothetical protein
MRITNISELIDFVSRTDVSFQDAEAVTNKCFGVETISFRDYDPNLDTKDNLIHKIKNDYQKSDLIHWQD